MKVVGLINWYDERPSFLAACVSALAVAVDHIVAVDGAYALYPEGRATSHPEQADTIRDTAKACGIGVTIHEPRSRWIGNEVEKRSAMFALGEAITKPDDWYMVMDADQVLERVPPNFRERLADADTDAGEVTFWERQEPPPEGDQFYWPPTSSFTIPILFRAIRGLRVEGKHYRYVTPNGRMLWGDAPAERYQDFTDIRVEHRSKQRHLSRRRSAKRYYEKRDELGIESTEQVQVERV